eukprot:138195-Prymnesium_polylepis.2
MPAAQSQAGTLSARRATASRRGWIPGWCGVYIGVARGDWARRGECVQLYHDRGYICACMIRIWLLAYYMWVPDLGLALRVCP